MSGRAHGISPRALGCALFGSACVSLLGGLFGVVACDVLLLDALPCRERVALRCMLITRFLQHASFHLVNTLISVVAHSIADCVCSASLCRAKPKSAIGFKLDPKLGATKAKDAPAKKPKEGGALRFCLFLFSVPRLACPLRLECEGCRPRMCDPLLWQ